MNEAFWNGFLDELEKSAKTKPVSADPTFLDKAEDIVRTIHRHGAHGAGQREGVAGKAWGALKGGYRGAKASFKKHPGMFLAPAAAYAGYELLKAIRGKDEKERR